MNWRIREESRFTDGTYKKIPWFADGRLNQIDGHYAHISKTPGQIAYTQNEKKGEADLQLSLKPGKYLTQFFKDVLDPQAINRMACEINNDEIELLFAKTPEEVLWVYRNGPESCMSKDESHYRSNKHPVTVYGNSDLQVAYLKHKGTISARCLVWPEKKFYGRIYGDSSRLITKLNENGYINRSLTGAKIRLVVDEVKNKIIAPYIDDTQYVKFVDDTLVICTSSERDAIQAGTTDGHLNVSICPSCKSFSKKNFKDVYNSECFRVQYCEECVSKNSFVCEGWQMHNTLDSGPVKIKLYGSNREYLFSKIYFNTEIFLCPYVNAYVKKNDGILLNDGIYVEKKYVKKNGTYDSETRKWSLNHTTPIPDAAIISASQEEISF